MSSNFSSAVDLVTSMPALIVYVVTGVAALLTGLLLHVILAQQTGAAAEMSAPGGPFRSMKTLAMLYPPLLAPAVQAALSLAMAALCFGAPAVRSWSAETAIGFTVALWLCSAAHGILLDYAVFRMTWRVALQWWVGSFCQALIVGWCMGTLL